MKVNPDKFQCIVFGNVVNPDGKFHIGEHLMAKNNLQNSLQFLVPMYR